MSSIYYTSLTGMMAAGFGLQNTSNNVSNMQSPGFKRSDVFYSSLGYDSNFSSMGSGVTVGGTVTSFSDGKYIPTSNPTELAIIGQGFFIVRMKTGEFLYTRDGEFVFNNAGILIDRHSGGVVQGYDSSGHLVSIHEKGPESAAGKASHHVYMKGKWVIEKEDDKTKDPNDPTPPDPRPADDKDTKNQYKNVTFEVASIYDAQGNVHTVKFEFNSDAKMPIDPEEWTLVSARCDDAEIDFDPDQKIQFNRIDDGYALKEASSIQFTLDGKQTVNVHFGHGMSDAETAVVTKEISKGSPPEMDRIQAYEQDGYGLGKQISFSFDDNGLLIYKYDNGQDIEGIHIGLARFDDMENTLVQTHDNLFRTKNNTGLHLGRANQAGFGSIKAKQLESSNVDATNEFANIVVLQRMFQACSQIMEIDKQLIDELNHTK